MIFSTISNRNETDMIFHLFRNIHYSSGISHLNSETNFLILLLNKAFFDLCYKIYTRYATLILGVFSFVFLIWDILKSLNNQWFKLKLLIFILLHLITWKLRILLRISHIHTHTDIPFHPALLRFYSHMSLSLSYIGKVEIEGPLVTDSLCSGVDRRFRLGWRHLVTLNSE